MILHLKLAQMLIKFKIKEKKREKQYILYFIVVPSDIVDYMLFSINSTK